MNGDGWKTGAYPYLIAMSFPLAVWLGNLSEEPTAPDVLATFAAAAVLVAGVDGILRRWIADAPIRSLWLALAVVGFFGYGHALALLQGFLPVQQRHVIPIWLVLLGSAAWGLRWVRRHKAGVVAARMAASASYALVAAQIAVALPAVWAHVGGGNAVWSLADARTPVARASVTNPTASQPDVYYIILDGYARGDVLKELHGFDNGRFLDALRSRGFYVAEAARSNYAQTRPSLGCSLSMDYLPPASDGASDDVRQEEVRQLRKQSRVVARLREQGYRYRFVGSMYFPVDAAADEEISPSGAGRTYLREFLATTALKSVERLVGLDVLVQDPVAINEFQFRNIARPKVDASPLFTFVHVVCPHEPYIYGRQGPLPQPVPPDEATASDYTAQIEYLNRRVLDVLDAIDRTSGPEAVVLLQADHGSSLLGMPEQPNAQTFFERMSILSAYRYPAPIRERLYPTISPVNSFRVLLAGLFGDDLRLREDRAYYSSYEAPFDFIEAPPQPMQNVRESCTVGGDSSRR